MMVLLFSAGAGEAVRLPWSDDFDDGNLDNWTVSKAGSGEATADSSQYVSGGYSMHVRSPESYDSVTVELTLPINKSNNYVVEFQFRPVGSNQMFELFRNYEMCLFLDTGSIKVQEEGAVIHTVMLTIPNTWYHVKLLYNATNQTSTLWVDGVEKDTFGREKELPNIRIGDTQHLTYKGEVFYDDFKVYYEDEPVPRPPTWLELPTLEAVEDVPLEFDFTPYVWARDMDPKDLRLNHSSPYVTDITGRTVTFLFPGGVVMSNVTLVLSDGRLTAPVDVNFTIEPVDDPPVVLTVLEVPMTEGVEKTVDLRDYIDDEDTPASGLTLACDDPACQGIEGMNITLLFNVWREAIVVEFTVSDAVSTAEGSLEVNLTAVNDPPRITGIGEHALPATIVIDEGTDVSLPIHVIDEDDTEVTITVVSIYTGITIGKGNMFNIISKKGEVVNVSAELTVQDPSGASSKATVTVEVRNVNDPPSDIDVLAPDNRTMYVEGNNVTFTVVVTDPDTKFGDVLTVSWSSNLAGPFKTLTSDSELTFKTDQLPAGEHIITVYATDGEATTQVSFGLTIVRETTSTDGDGTSLFESTAFLAGVGALVIVIVVVAILGFVMAGRRRREREAAAAAAAPAAGVSTSTFGDEDLGREAKEFESALDRLEAQRQLEAVKVAPEEAAFKLDVDMAAIAAPETDEEMAAANRARELRDLRKGLMQLPTGLPKPLEGRDLTELATAIIDGERGTTLAGTPIAKVEGVWYHVNLDDMNTFMKEYKEPAPAAPKAAKAAPPAKGLTLAEKLEQLEVRLITGEIDEATYEELKERYKKEG